MHNCRFRVDLQLLVVFFMSIFCMTSGAKTDTNFCDLAVDTIFGQDLICIDEQNSIFINLFMSSALPILFLGEVCAPVSVGLIYLSVFISVLVSSSLDLIFISRSTDETPHVSLKSFSTSNFGPSLLLSTYLVWVNFFIFSVSVSELCHIGFNCRGVF